MPDGDWGSRIWFGGDHNPEQWDASVRAQDGVLMRRARVNVATVGVFSWSMLEPREGCYRFEWLDETLDRLHADGIRVVLATPTASPPPWFTLAHGDALPVSPQGTRLWHGSRDTYCAAAPAYRVAALRVARQLGARYGHHPAVAMWHVHNEYGSLCWCDHVAEAFRRWLRRRYAPGEAGLAALNHAWGTAFWSQCYSEWEQVLPPRATQWWPNPSQLLDFRRFWSDELLDAYREQRDVLREHSPDIPITTNLMLPAYQNLDLWRWGREVDVVAVDLYPAPGPEGLAELAFGADRARSFNRGRPWLLMESSAGTYPQGERSQAKEPGALLRHSLAYLARGSDSVMFFQWRASAAGAELHHSGMVPHAGPDSRVFREVTRLGEVLERLTEIAGSTVDADVAILWDADAWWALDIAGLPSDRIRYLDALREAHAVLREAGVVTDFAAPGHDLSRYRVVVAPSLYLLDEAGATRLARYVSGGGHLVLGCFSGVVDSTHRAHLGGTPGGLREVFGVRVEEFHPVPDGEPVALSGEATGPLPGGATGRLWSEDLRSLGASAVATYASGVLAGQPAVTRHRHGTGTAWYVSTRLVPASLAGLLRGVLDEAGAVPVLPDAPPGVEAVPRRAADGRAGLFLLNHSAADVQLPVTGLDLLTGTHAHGTLHLAAGAAAVLRTPVPGR